MIVRYRAAHIHHGQQHKDVGLHHADENGESARDRKQFDWSGALSPRWPRLFALWLSAEQKKTQQL